MAKADNEVKIVNAFSRLRQSAEKSFLEGMRAVLDAGVAHCLAEHDNLHRRHADEGDGYGWVLLHNGVEIERKLYGSDADLQRNASEALTYAAGRAKGIGWMGIVLATLLPVTYFQTLYEFVPMRAGIRDLKSEDFNKYFKSYTV